MRHQGKYIGRKQQNSNSEELYFSEDSNESRQGRKIKQKQSDVKSRKCEVDRDLKGINDERCVKEEENQEANQQQNDSEKLKEKKDSDSQFQYVYEPIKKRGRPKNIGNCLKVEDTQTIERKLKQGAIEYHKRLIKQSLDELGLKIEEELKKEAKQQPLNKDLSTFPLMSFLDIPFEGIGQLRQQLEAHEEEILARINEPGLVSVFRSRLVENIKTCSNTCYVQIRCSLQGCLAHIKLNFGADGRNISLFRNKHNHTISGEKVGVTTEKQPRPIQTITIDQCLHEQFGLYKGVRSETRNQHYMDPEQRRREKQKTFSGGRKRDKFAKFEQQKATAKRRVKKNSSDDQIQDRRSLKKKNKQKNKLQIDNKRGAQNTKTKIQDRQFKDIKIELASKNLKIELHGNVDNTQDKGISFPRLIYFSTHEMIARYLKQSELIKIVMIEKTIDLQSKVYSQKEWAIIMFSGLNSALSPILFGICFIQQKYLNKLSFSNTVLCFLRTMGKQPKYVLTQNEPIITQAIQNLRNQSLFVGRQLIDQEEIYLKLHKNIKEQKNLKRFKTLLLTTSKKHAEEIMLMLAKRGQDQALKIFQEFQQRSTLYSLSPQFTGFNLSLKSANNICSLVKEKLSLLPKFYTFKQAFGKVLEAQDLIAQYAQQSIKLQGKIHIEKIHNDPMLAQLRNQISPKILNKFYLNYGEALCLEIEKSKVGRDEFQKQSVDLNTNICSCQYQAYTGIPCTHLIRSLLERSLSYKKNFAQRWLIRDNT